MANYYKIRQTNLPLPIIDRMQKFKAGDNSVVLYNRDDVKELLYLWNRTESNNSATVNIIDFEMLNYLEWKYQNDLEIMQLIQPLKEYTARIYEFKSHWIDNVIDKNLFDSVEVYRNKFADRLRLYNDELDEFLKQK